MASQGLTLLKSPFLNRNHARWIQTSSWPVSRLIIHSLLFCKSSFDDTKSNDNRQPAAAQAPHCDAVVPFVVMTLCTTHSCGCFERSPAVFHSLMLKSAHTHKIVFQLIDVIHNGSSAKTSSEAANSVLVEHAMNQARSTCGRNIAMMQNNKCNLLANLNNVCLDVCTEAPGGRFAGSKLK